MRIVHIDRQRSWTGQIKRVFDVAVAMRECGHELALIAHPGSQLAQRGREEGFDVLEVRMRGWRAYPSVLKIARFLRAKPVDVLHSHGPRDHFYTVLASRLARVKHLVRTKHNHTRLRSGYLSRLLYNKTSAVIALSEHVRENLLADGILPEDVTVIYDAIDVERFAPRAKDPAILEQHGLTGVESIVGSLSSLHRRKGTEELLRAYKHLRQLLPDESMKCVLTGKRFDQWLPLVEELRLQGEVVFTGFQTDVPAYLALLDVYVLPSREEGLGNSILEAMCMELPVVVSDAGGIPESVIPGTGVVLSDTSPEPLAAAIRELILDPAKRRALGVAGRARVLEQFADHLLFEQTDALYRSL